MKLIGKIWKKLPKSVRTRVTRTVQPKFTASVAGIITNEKGQVLLLNHVLRPVSGWGAPGGFLNVGEQAEAAFRREINEETGLVMTDVSIHRIRTFKRHIEIMFLAKASEKGEIMSREITELVWFDVDNMPPEMSLDMQFLIRNALLPEDWKKSDANWNQ